MSDVKNERIEDKLREAWRQERRFCNLRGAGRLLVWLVAMIALDFLIDWGILARSGASAKIGALLPVLNVVVLGWVLWHEWLRHLRKYDPLRVALEVETRHPELSSLLVSYTQLEATVAKQPNVSRELVEAMRGQAIDRTRPLDFREIVNFGQLRNLLFVTVGSLLFFSVLGLNWQEHLRTLFQRLVGVEVSYPTRTQVVEVSGEIVARIGDSVDVSARAAGVIPEEGQIFTRPANSDADWKKLPMPRSQNEPSYSRELKALTMDLVYYVRLGDDESAEHRIRVIPSPRVVSARLTLTYPPYMNREPGETDQLNVEVPEGTSIGWQLVCAPAVKRLEVKTDDATLEADIDSRGENATFALVADKAFKYTFRWTERGSGKDFEYDDVQYNVRVVADTVPEVELLRPAANGLATVKKTLDMRVRAKDDHGLSTAWLVYSIDGSEEKRVSIHDFAGVDAWDFPYSWSLAESIEDLKPGVRIIFAVEVGDLHPSGEAHSRRSASRQLTIVDPEHYLQWYRGELAAQNDEIRRALSAEKTSSKRVKDLKVQEGGSP